MSDTPSHYQLNPEPIELCGGMPFCLGNIVKYCARAGLKGDPVADLKKAVHYLELERARIRKAYPHGPRQMHEREVGSLLLWEASDAYAAGTEHEQKVSMRLSKFAWALANDTTPEGILR